jgi:hypothetical protein
MVAGLLETRSACAHLVEALRDDICTALEALKMPCRPTRPAAPTRRADCAHALGRTDHTGAPGAA